MELDLSKFVRLEQRAEDARDLLRSATGRHRDAVNERQRLQALQREQRALGHTGYRTTGRSYTATGTAVEEQVPVRAGESPELLADLERIEATVATTREHVEEIRATTEPLIALVARLREFLREQHVDLQRLPPAGRAPRPEGPAPSLEDLTTVRAHRAGLQRERAAIATAPASREEIAAGVDAWMANRLAAIEQLPISGLLTPGQDVRLVPVESGIFTDRLRARVVEGLAALIGGAALRGFLLERIDREVMARGGYGLGAAERQARLQELDAAIFHAELQEEALIEQLEAHGVAAVRRPDADPRAVLAAA